MKIFQINQRIPDRKILGQAAAVLNEEKILLHPTETVYGLAGIYSSEKAIKGILEIKRRSPDHPFSIMVNSVEQIIQISGVRKEGIAKFLENIFPAAITVLLRRKRSLHFSYWNQFPLIGFRYPDHPLSNQLIEKTGKPVVTTSANLTSELPPSEIDDISEQVINKADMVLDGGPTWNKIPSTIIKVEDDKNIKLIRKGAVPWEKIEKEIW